MRRLLAVLCVLLSLPLLAEADSFRVGVNIASQTTTTIVSAIAGQRVQIQGGSICLDASGTTTALKFQDSAGTNLVGTSVVYVLAPGQCLVFFPRNGFYYNPTAAGTSLQIVTTVANGPLEVYLEGIQQ